MSAEEKAAAAQGPYSAGALRVMQTFFDEILSDEALKTDFQLLESSLFYFKEHCVSGWSKVDKLITTVRAHLKKRSLPDTLEGLFCEGFGVSGFESFGAFFISTSGLHSG